MKKIICVLLFMSITVSTFAQITIEGDAPTFTGTNQILVDSFNNEVASAFNNVISDLNNNLNDMTGGMNPFPREFTRAWGNANIFASHGATQRAYSGYRIATVSVGTMFGGQFPVEPWNFIRSTSNLLPGLRGGDIAFGMNPQFFNIQIGVNMGFLLDNFYLGFRFGGVSLDNFFNDFTVNSHTFGVLLNYQLLPRVNFVVVEWMGLNLGTGFIFQRTDVGLLFPMDRVTQPIASVGDLNAAINIDPTLYFNINIETYTVPLEVMTAIRIATFKIPFGIGADLGFGSTSMNVGVRGNVNVDGFEGSGLTQESSGTLSIDAGGSVEPTIFNVKLMTGLGFVLGPVFIDIPFTYYFRGNGLSLGFTLGVSF